MEVDPIQHYMQQLCHLCAPDHMAQEDLIPFIMVYVNDEGGAYRYTGCCLNKEYTTPAFFGAYMALATFEGQLDTDYLRGWMACIRSARGRTSALSLNDSPQLQTRLDAIDATIKAMESDLNVSQFSGASLVMAEVNLDGEARRLIHRIRHVNSHPAIGFVSETLCRLPVDEQTDFNTEEWIEALELLDISVSSETLQDFVRTQLGETPTT